MVGAKRVLGVCVRKSSSSDSSKYIKEFYELAKKHDMVLVIYNIFSDVNTGEDQEAFLVSLDHLVDYSYVDAIVVIKDEKTSEEAAERLLSKAKEAGAPRAVIGMYVPDAFCIQFQGVDAMEAIIRHVVEQHQCKNVFFYGVEGHQTKNEECAYVFDEVLHENGLDDDEERFFLLNESYDACMEQIKKTLASGVAPDAIICDGDVLAINVSRALNELGYSIPENVIVTGFGGDSREKNHFPRLTSAVKDFHTTACIIMDIIINNFSGEKYMEMALRQQYQVEIRHSCGCKKPDTLEYAKAASAYYDVLNAHQISEERTNAVSGALSTVSTKEELNKAVSEVLPPRSYIALSDEFWNATDEVLSDSSFESTMTIIRSRQPMLNERKQIFPQGTFFPSNESIDQAVSAVEVYMLRYLGNFFGYFVASADFLEEMYLRKERFVNMLDVTFNGIYSRFLLKKTSDKLENLQIRDPLTGVYNLKGFVRSLNEKYLSDVSDAKLIIISFDIGHFRRLNEMYGHAEGDNALLALAEIIKSSGSVQDICGRSGADEYILAVSTIEDTEYIIFNYMNSFYQNLKNYNSIYAKPYNMDVHTAFEIGTPKNEDELNELINKAIDNKNRKKKLEENKDVSRQNLSEKDLADIEQFKKLISDNLFRYMFQPIVNAKNGSVYAYEALMRTTGGIEMSPIRILEIANILERFSDVEHATFYNVMKYVYDNEEKFGRKKVFINSIVGERISTESMDNLFDMYGEIAGRVVVEMTEQTNTTDKAYGEFVNYLNNKGVQMAIDDYGTGYSNTSRLIEYTPSYVKIDRSLITGIHSDFKKQHFVNTIIQYAHDNGFAALAEGVEDAFEMKTVIKLGVDYIQGYYTARPSFDVITNIDSTVEREILLYNTSSTNPDDERPVYTVGGDEEIYINEIADRGFSKIRVISGRPVFKLEGEMTSLMEISVQDGYKGCVVFDNLKLANVGACFQLGLGCEVDLNLIGDNYMSAGGILVPSSSELRIGGVGSLNINIENDRVVGIGGTCDTSYGKIVVMLQGEINMKFAADVAVGIGGGFNDNDSQIYIENTSIKIESSVSIALGIGTLFDYAFVSTKNANFEFSAGCREFIGIGSKKGNVNISLIESTIKSTIGGNELLVVGTLAKFDKNIVLKRSFFDLDVKGKEVIVCGAHSGKGHIVLDHSKFCGIVESADAIIFGNREKDGYLDYLESENELEMTAELGIVMAFDEKNISIVGK